MKTKRFLSAIMAICMALVMMPLTIIAEDVTEPTQPTNVHYYGDANQDDVLNTGDASMILKHCAELSKLDDAVFERTADGIMKIDANKDDELNTADATYILRASADLATANEYYDAEPATAYMVSYTEGTLPEELPEGITIVTVEPGAYEAGAEVEVAAMPSYETTGSDAAAAEIPEGFVFLGWNASFDHKDYQPGEMFVMPAEDVVFTAHWEGVELPTEVPTDVPTDEPTNEPTEVPTNEPTNVPTDVPTNEPTEVPTEAPTEAPQTATLRITFYDKFNEQNAGNTTMTLTSSIVLNASNLELPEGYTLENGNYSQNVNVANGVATPSTITVNVKPVAIDGTTVYTVIKTQAGFNKINSDLAGNYLLGTDINLGNQNRMPFGWNWQNPEADDTEFTGHFNGNGYFIENIKIDYCMSDDGLYGNVGLFASNKGVIENLVILGQVYGDYNVGMIAGRNTGTIRDCYAYGNVGALDYEESSRGACGGIAGSNEGTVERCSYEGYAEGYYWIGGIVGKNFGTISESYFAGGINSGLYADGVVAQAANLGVYISYIGGICGGMQNGTIKNSYAYLTDTLDGYQAVGGMIGWSKGGTLTNVMIANHSKKIFAVNSDYAATDIGYLVSNPTYSGLCSAAGDVLVENGQLPAGYSPEIWSMNGKCHAKLPDLINNPRPEGGFYSE